jgi:hypothetical protein
MLMPTYPAKCCLKTLIINTLSSKAPNSNSIKFRLKLYEKVLLDADSSTKRPTEHYGLTDMLVNGEDEEVQSGVSHKIVNRKTHQTVQVTGKKFH